VIYLAKAFKTITLKLHNPSSYKKRVMDEALMNYTRAFQYLLQRANDEIEEISSNFIDEKGQYRTYNIKNWFRGDIDAKLNEFSIEPFKDSIKIDFSGVIAEYLTKQKMGEDINFPSGYISEEEHEKKASRVVHSFGDNCEITHSNNTLIQGYKKMRPIYFCRYSERRNFCVLYAPLEDRYYAKVYLMNVKNDKRKIALCNNSKKLIYINKNKDSFIENGRKNCYLLFPLAFGKYQEEYLREARNKPEVLKTARLYKKGEEYFLSINIEIEKKECIETTSYLGVSRSLVKVVNCTIVDNEGDQLSSSGIDSMTEDFEESELNRLANEILELGRKNHSQIILENLNKIGDKLGWVEKNGRSYYPIININKYNKLASILENKVNEYELPKPIRVSGVGIYYTCPNCLSNSEANRYLLWLY
jgi:putative transposase